MQFAFFSEKFTHLTRILHDRRSHRSRQISTLPDDGVNDDLDVDEDGDDDDLDHDKDDSDNDEDEDIFI